MAQRRMFSRRVTESDSFLDLSPMAQLLWFHLGMAADDEGLLNNTRFVRSLCGASRENQQELIERGFLIELGSGIYALAHWHANNQIKSDRRKPTEHVSEFGKLSLDESKVYHLNDPLENDGSKMEPRGFQDGHAVKNSLVEASTDQVSEDKASPDQDSPVQEREGEARKGERERETEALYCPTCATPLTLSMLPTGKTFHYCDGCYYEYPNDSGILPITGGGEQ